MKQSFLFTKTLSIEYERDYDSRLRQTVIVVYCLLLLHKTK